MGFPWAIPSKSVLENKNQMRDYTWVGVYVSLLVVLARLAEPPHNVIGYECLAYCIDAAPAIGLICFVNLFQFMISALGGSCIAGGKIKCKVIKGPSRCFVQLHFGLEHFMTVPPKLSSRWAAPLSILTSRLAWF